MSEEKTITTESSTITGANPEKEDKPETIELIKQQSERIKELEDADFKREEEKAKEQLGGKTLASQVPEKKDEVKPEQYLSDVLAGKFNKKRE